MNKDALLLGLEPSAIRELFEYGKKRKMMIGEDNVFDFSIGNPSIPSPQKVKDILIKNLDIIDPIKLHGYTSAAGDLEVRNKIAHYLNETYQTNVSGQYIFLSCGAAASLTMTFHGLLNAGNEVIGFAPYFPEYKVFIEGAGATFKAIMPNDDFSLDLDSFEKSITENTKIVLIDSPNNPTGALYSEEEIKRIAEILKKKQEEFKHPIYLVSDEPYRELIYEDKKYPFITNYYDNAVVCYSFSKSLSLPGERIGYVLINPNCDEATCVFAAISGAARKLGFVCAPSMFQYLIGECLGVTSDISAYKKNRDILYNSLRDIGYEIVYPEGAFYMFVKALEDDAKHFSLVAREFELLIVPSDTFGYPGYVRLSYCVSEDLIKRSIPAFEKLYERYRGK